ncbi:unnamed protein product [Parnassius mnemosyne]|uniref:Uncharacterized protein n=1 Tax=Parnassius mnemosyne TaxID=213953 RepID=A0AAV1M8N7_9NEOP
MDQVSLEQILMTSFTEDEIIQTKKVLADSAVTQIHLITHRRDGRVVTPNLTGNEINNEIQDITLDDGIMGEHDYLLSPSMTAAVPIVTEITSEPGPSSVPDGMDVELDESILSLLGDAPQSAIQLGPPLHKDMLSFPLTSTELGARV